MLFVMALTDLIQNNEHVMVDNHQLAV
jgi:hypothetical protein